jgi:hypothetical protein
MTPANLIRKVFFLLLLAATAAPLAAQQKLEPASWGERFNSQGASLRIMEMERTPRSEGGTWVHYFVQGIGLPKKELYSLWEWELGSQPTLVQSKVPMRDDGVLLCSGKPNDCSGASDEQVYASRMMGMKGEPKRLALVSSDGRVRAFGTAVPFPVAASDKSCKVSLERKRVDGAEATVNGSGFPPKERVTIAVAGETSGATLRRNADDAGNWSADLSHTGDSMHADGSSQIAVKGKNCSVTVPWAWGKETQKAE